ncbi:Proteasome subunit beta type 4 [Giardia muris]|uniref:Proteasome subunit beta n=1 Tax=Giardia muris TaxID=5742 RepID=A0A4Z1SLA7_GIAMU|nr:Proteasome subunit beta type 4 [Giardia muris]|eukprot:TNJ26280.1 Proteasome subunit beta type 4 [Giardia muris]
MSYLTGSAVIAISYKDGVILGADTALVYGSTRKVFDYSRLVDIGGKTILGFTGDEADFRETLREIDELRRTARCYGDSQLGAEGLHGFLSTRNYQARCEMTPIYNSFLVAGMDKGSPFLGVTDVYGTQFTVPFFATGIGKYYVMSLLRESWRPDLTREEAVEVVRQGLTILAYNTSTAIQDYVLGHVSSEGVEISGIQKLELNWEIASYKDASLRV